MVNMNLRAYELMATNGLIAQQYGSKWYATIKYINLCSKENQS